MSNIYKKHPKYGFVRGSDILTPAGRLVWPCLVKPKDGPPPKQGEKAATPRYEITLLLDADAKETQEFFAKIKEMAAEMIDAFNDTYVDAKGKKKARIAAPLNADTCRLFQDGDDSQKFNPEKYPYYKSKAVLVARNSVQPGFVSTKQLEDGTFETLDLKSIEGGLIGKLRVQPLVTAHGVSYKLVRGQITKDDGERFGGGFRDADDMWEACEPTKVTTEAVATEVVSSENGLDSAVDLL